MDISAQRVDVISLVVGDLIAPPGESNEITKIRHITHIIAMNGGSDGRLHVTVTYFREDPAARFDRLLAFTGQDSVLRITLDVLAHVTSVGHRSDRELQQFQALRAFAYDVDPEVSSAQPGSKPGTRLT